MQYAPSVVQGRAPMAQVRPELRRAGGHPVRRQAVDAAAVPSHEPGRQRSVERRLRRGLEQLGTRGRPAMLGDDEWDD
uniref:Uncharacterized protein n=1 Tax=Janibacter limosus TaxID=53458 RepID=A0AC61U248_9MICO|nr:hypothetical protein [Janibacter limosus]